jgi:hypothetical protein
MSNQIHKTMKIDQKGFVYSPNVIAARTYSCTKCGHKGNQFLTRNCPNGGKCTMKED